MPLTNLKNNVSAQVNSKKPKSDNSILKYRTILLIDDEEIVVKITKKMLQKLGYKIIKAHSGQEGLKLFQTYRDRIDLIICDMIMPKMDGLELVFRLREIDPGVKVLLSSGSLIDEDEKDIVLRGFDGLIKKPYKMNDLSEKIGKIIK